MGAPVSLKNFIPQVEWPILQEEIEAILHLKKERKALILAHNYMTPDIFHGISDIRGDSLALAQQAVGLDVPVILVCGVHFMAETVKILNPDKTVLIADLNAGCSLAESITANEVKKLKAKHPGVPVVTYVNTSAEVKAESDICCTSGNALKIVESLPGNEVIFIPDKFLAENVAKQSSKKIYTHDGSCIVHERFSADDILDFRSSYPGAKILAHPECPRPVTDNSDYTGSTAQMIQWIKTNRPQKVMLLTECSMSDNIAKENPEIEFVKPCNLCPHMKRITLPKIKTCLQNLTPEVNVAPDVIQRARRAIERMLEVGR